MSLNSFHFQDLSLVGHESEKKNRIVAFEIFVYEKQFLTQNAMEIQFFEKQILFKNRERTW